MVDHPADRRSLAWSRGVVTLEALGGMIGPASFVLPDGRQVSPFHIAPWFAENALQDQPGILRRLRGEWPCVPFGADAERSLPHPWPAGAMTFDGSDVPHGHASNVDWQFVSSGPESIDMACAYPDAHPVKDLRRSVRPDPGAAALDVTLTIAVRRPCSLPIGLHPTFRLPHHGRAELKPPLYREGRVFPLPVEPSSLLRPDATFQSLDLVPTLSGKPISLSHLPLAGTNEDLVQLCGVSGDFVLRYPEDGFQLRLSWNTQHFPSVLLWISNRGRSHAPWNSRHLALGIEPVCSAFDLGPAVSAAPNPIANAGVATTMDFTPDRIFTTKYRIAVEPLE